MNKLESNKLLAALARLELQCVLGTEDGKFHVYYDPFEKDYLFVGRWVDIWYEEDIRYRPLNPGRYATGEKTSMKFQLDSRNYTANKYGQFADMNT